ncbi:MAG: hypothetical protein JO020_00080 [Chloroflexi bacterium]|nr:hypothetical protein [Chloroflexota bacterium]
MAAMNLIDNERPWADTPRPLRMYWVGTDSGLQMRWLAAPVSVPISEPERGALSQKQVEAA